MDNPHQNMIEKILLNHDGESESEPVNLKVMI